MIEENMTLLLRIVLIFLVIFCLGSGQDVSVPQNLIRFESSTPAASAPLSATASAQADAGDDEVTALIPNLRGESGQVRSDGTSASSESVGFSDNADSAVLLSFNISSIPREASISDVALEFRNWDIVGNPFSNLGCLNIYPASFASYRSQSYSRRSTESAYARICNSNQLNSRTSSRSLTRALTDSLGEDRFQLRLQFDRRMEFQPPTETRPEEPDTGTKPPDDPLPPPRVNPDLLATRIVLSEDIRQLSTPITILSIGFDSFLQDDLVRKGDSISSRYILLTPDLNLSEIGITPDLIKKAINSGQVKVAQFAVEQTCPKGQTFDSSTGDCCRDSNGNEICDYRENNDNLIVIGNAQLRVRYSLPPPVPPTPPVTSTPPEPPTPSVPPEGRAPDLGVGYFKPPEASSLSESVDWGEVPANQVLVMIDSNLGFEVARSVARQLATDLGGEVVGEFQYLNLFQIETDSQSLDELANDIDIAGRYNFAALAFPNQQVYRESPLDNRVYQGESGKSYQIIGLKNAWDTINSSSISLSEVRIGVTDDGLYKGYGQFNNTDINTSIELYPGAPPCLLNSPLPDFQIAGSHGTGIMNLLTANPERGGLVGIAYIPLSSEKKLKTDMINIYDENDKSFITISLLGLKAEIENRCTILSCSWGNSRATDDTTAMYEIFFTNLLKDYPHLLFICSAGNDGMEMNGRKRIPNGIPSSLLHGSLSNVITVGNILNNGTMSPSSNRNKDKNYVTLAAPGEEAVWGMDNAGRILNYGGGTSMATPQVTAAAALIRSINPGLTAGEIKNILIETGLQDIDGIPAPAELGGIVLDIDKALKKTINERPRNIETPVDAPPIVVLPGGSTAEIPINPETTGTPTSGFAEVTIRSTIYEGYAVTVDGYAVGTEGSRGDALDGVYTFIVSGDQEHLIRADHPQNRALWQDFYNAGNSYTYYFSP